MSKYRLWLRESMFRGDYVMEIFIDGVKSLSIYVDNTDVPEKFIGSSGTRYLEEKECVDKLRLICNNIIQREKVR